MEKNKTISLEQMPELAKEIIKLLGKEATISLEGDLGAGKTTLVQCILKELGYHHRVKSPTYNIIEEYTVEGLKVYHLDLYRVVDAQELEYLAIDDIFATPCLRFIEWYENAQGELPQPDLTIQIKHDENKRIINIIK
jgi:tRNA threonylcarbamoyladenosine biosynthesis protein TsaE